MTENGRLIDTNDCTINTVRQHRCGGSDAPKQNPTQYEIMKGYSLSGGLFGSIDVGKVIEEMITRKLIFEKADGKLYTDTLGYDVLDMGGWDNYQLPQKWNRFKEKWQYILLWPSFGVTLLSLVASLYLGLTRQQTLHTQDKQAKQINKLELQLDSMSKNHVYSTNTPKVVSDSNDIKK